MLKTTYLIMTANDEEAYGAALAAARPTMAFVNGTRWEQPDPPLVSSIAAATAGRVLLWDRQLHAERVIGKGRLNDELLPKST